MPYFQGFGAVYVLTERRTKSLYVEIFRRLKTLVPSLIDTLRTVVTDYEGPLLSAIREEFPRTVRVGCEFHFYQVRIDNWDTSVKVTNLYSLLIYCK